MAIVHATVAIVISDDITVESRFAMVTPWSPPDTDGSITPASPYQRQFNGISHQVVRDRFEYRVELR